MPAFAPCKAQKSEKAYPRFYEWRTSETALKVRLSLEVIGALEREMIEAFRAITNRGSEVGGILLGHMGASGDATITIESYEPVACDYRRGPLYLFADGDRLRLREVLKQRRARPEGLTVVGFYRSHTRRELAPDEDDAAIFREHFNVPGQVLLLVKPFASKASIGAFFLQDKEGLKRQCIQVFPFRASELESVSKPFTPVQDVYSHPSGEQPLVFRPDRTVHAISNRSTPSLIQEARPETQAYPEPGKKPAAIHTLSGEEYTAGTSHKKLRVAVAAISAITVFLLLSGILIQNRRRGVAPDSEVPVQAAVSLPGEMVMERIQNSTLQPAPAAGAPKASVPEIAGEGVRAASANSNAPVFIEVRAKASAWIRVTADEKVTYTGTLQAGESRNFEANRSIVVFTGNAGGMDIFWKGKSIGPLGPESRVRIIEFSQEQFTIGRSLPTETE